MLTPEIDAAVRTIVRDELAKAKKVEETAVALRRAVRARAAHDADTVRRHSKRSSGPK